MKKLTVLLILLCALLSAAGCRGRNAESSGRKSAVAKTAVSTEPGKTVTAPVTGQEEPVVIEPFNTPWGEHAASDGEHIFFTVDSDGDPLSTDPASDGLYRAGLSLEDPVRLARGYCHSIVLDGETVYFIMEDVSGVCSVCSVDKNGSAIRRIVRDVEGAQSLGMCEGKLFFVYEGSLCIVDDMQTGGFSRYSPEYNKVLQAQSAGEDRIWLSAVNPNTLDKMLYVHFSDEGKTWGVSGLGSDFTSSCGAAYYLFIADGQPEYEDQRKYESVLMCISEEKPDPTYTGIRGRFSGDLYACGNLLFYTKYVEVSERAGKGETTLRKLFCYDPETGRESALPRDEFIGTDFSVCSVTNGRLFYDVFYNRTGLSGDEEHSGCFCCDLAGSGKTLDLNVLAASAPDSEAVTADDKAVQDFIEERERQRQEELKNTPYGPGKSYLYLKAGSRSECYRLVKMDGTTQFKVFLSPGESVKQSFPCGKYVLKVARGETWISDEEAFGDSGYYSTTDVFDFKSGASYEISVGTTGSFRGDSRDGFTG